MERRAQRFGFAVVCAAAFLALPGCRMDPPMDPARAEKEGLAECPVCRCEGDLGCLVVRIRDTTPRCTYDGRTWYFCSRACHDQFLRDPARYAALARR